MQFFWSTYLVWFALAGMAVGYACHWLAGFPLSGSDAIKAGAVIGILTGGLASIVLYLYQQVNSKEGLA